MRGDRTDSPRRANGRFPDVWGGVPARNKNFTGRAAQLAELHAGLTSEITTVIPHALHGYGGVGKTLAAVEYAHRYREEYDLVWWINAEQPGLVRSSLAHLAPYLGLPGAASSGIEDAANAALDSLRRGDPYQRWLLIYDNADEPEDLQDIIPTGHENGHVLVTSRNHRWGAVSRTVSVNVFPPEESIEFLKKRISGGVTDAEASELAEALGHLPLALEQAGALRAETGMSNSQYLRLLQEQPASLLSEGKPGEYPAPMTAAWRLSVNRLREDVPEAMELLRCCAFFGPDPIPRDVFFPVENDRIRPAMYDLLADPIRLSRAIGQLARYALIRLDNTNRTIQVHRLIQTLVRSELSPDEQRSVREEAWSLLSAAAPQSTQNSDARERYRALLPHLDPSGIAESTEPVDRSFALEVLSFLYQSGAYELVRRYTHRFVELWTRSSGLEDRYVIDAQTRYANRLRASGSHREAYELDLELLPRAVRTLGETDHLTLMIRSGIGADLRAKGDFRGALLHDEETLSTHEKHLQTADAATVRAMYNLAIDHTLTGDFSRALMLHRRAYELQNRDRETQASPALLSYLNGLAWAVRLTGSYVEACDLSSDALAYGVEQLGVDHPRTLRAQADLSRALRMSGDLDGALEEAQDAHTRHVRLYGIDHPETLAAATALTNVWRMTGHWSEALELAQDTELRYARMYSPEHPYRYGCTGTVALLQRLMGDPGNARRTNEKARAGLVELLGLDNHYALCVTANLASDLAALGETEKAVSLGNDARQRLQAILGEEHPWVLRVTANLVLDLRSAGEHREADLLAGRLEPLFLRALGREQQFTRAFMTEQRLSFDFDPRQL